MTILNTKQLQIYHFSLKRLIPQRPQSIKVGFCTSSVSLHKPAIIHKVRKFAKDLKNRVGLEGEFGLYLTLIPDKLLNSLV